MRFHDKVGYKISTDLGDGVWSDVITERTYYGTVLDVTKSPQESEKVNDDFRLQNDISVVADGFALENFTNIKYVLWMGTRWVVNSAKVQRPRLLLSLGGVYHGKLPEGGTQ